MTVQNTWKLLEDDTPNVTSGYITRRLLPEVTYDVYLAIERPSNARLLMMRVKHKSIGKGGIFPNSNCFEVRRVALQGDDDAHVTLQLVLINSRYSDIFTTLVQDIVDEISPIADEQNAVAAFFTRLRRWQAFLEKHSPEGLSQAEQQGLYGELWFLRQIVIPQIGSRQGVECWTGAKGTQQDFQFQHCAIEVKTTVAKQHQKLAISSERQLDDTGTGTLILLHLSLDARQNRGESLPDIVVSLRSLLENDPIAKEQLETLLFEVGYLEIHTPYYEQIGYTPREVNYFKVEGDFPRIIEADLRNGIGDVRYTISVAECRRFSIPELNVISLIEGSHK
ncbi:PD-(D/E)XK motif protein [Argonema galeatum]|uniref:PD-(D/E)XK motif protein n=1 Tax=Argonema galeatum TaxID=2942762 RepID=UPI0020116A31|nr:PD-(D/E)XK motif protein [Argonema galeatum]MCL1465506.1 PD-(D/E)XK motif protein [Argonema galeatum A003/A1]